MWFGSGSAPVPGQAGGSWGTPVKPAPWFVSKVAAAPMPRLLRWFGVPGPAAKLHTGSIGSGRPALSSGLVRRCCCSIRACGSRPAGLPVGCRHLRPHQGNRRASACSVGPIGSAMASSGVHGAVGPDPCDRCGWGVGHWCGFGPGCTLHTGGWPPIAGYPTPGRRSGYRPAVPGQLPDDPGSTKQRDRRRSLASRCSEPQDQP